MKYTKPPLTFEQQADLLLLRGLNSNKEKLTCTLRSVSYYRLNEYFYYFKDKDGSFKAGNNFDIIWRNYTFDRQLRLLVLDVLERVEVALRTDISYYHAHKYGPFGYTENATLPNLYNRRHEELLERIKSETGRSSETFVKKFFREHGDCHEHLPVFRVTEVMSFGSLLSFYRGLESKGKKIISSRYNIKAPVLESWLLTLNYIRNICAHHGRLFNKVLGVKPMIPHKSNNPEWHKPFPVSNAKVFSVILILRYLLNIVAPQSKWKGRLAALMKTYNEIPPRIMGFPLEWEKHDIWK